LTDTTGLSAEEVVRLAYDLVEKTGDIDQFLAVFADDAVLEESSWLPYGGEHRGKPAIKETITRIMTGHWRDFTIVINGYTSDAEMVIVDLTLTATGSQTGKTASFRVLEMWKVLNGKVVWLRPVYGDYGQIREALALG
jgi:ketosteroid isomerase-like protein